MTEKDNQVSRRALIATVGAAAASATMAGSTQALAASPPTAGSIHWDYQADIVCVGSGAAALTAAVVAHGNGDEVIVIEKRAVTGGTTAKSGAVHWIPNNPALRAKGIKDRRKDALEYMVRFSHPNSFVAGHPTMGASKEDFELISAYYDHGYAMVDRLIAMKVYQVMPWTYAALGLQMHPDTDPLSTSTPDYFSQAPEDKVKSGRAIAMRRDDGNLASGAEFVERFETFLTDRKQLVLTKHRARDLVLNGKGEVIGLKAEHDGKAVFLRARKAVIFGTGGFAHNPKLVHKFHKSNIFGSCAASGSEGDIIPIATRAGAALGNMLSAWRANVVVEETLENHEVGSVMFMPTGDSMIFVNRYGRRFVDEYRSYNSRGKVFDTYDATEEEYPNHLGFMIFDQRTIDIYGGNAPIPLPGENSRWVIAGSDFEDLTAKIAARLNKLRANAIGTRLADTFTAELKATVEKFNNYAKNGMDEQFSRGKYDFDKQMFLAWSLPRDRNAAKGQEFLSNPTMYPISSSGPYYAVIIGMGVLDTNGGPVINAKAQIVDYDDRPIPGLYGAGNCIACPSRETYYGPGGTVGPAMTFGYIAANNAHSEPIKEL